MSTWNEIYDYIMSHKDQVHVFGSREMGWIRLSWPGSSKMLFKSTCTMKDAEHYLQHALKFMQKYTNKKAAAETAAINKS